MAFIKQKVLFVIVCFALKISNGQTFAKKVTVCSVFM